MAIATADVCPQMQREAAETSLEIGSLLELLNEEMAREADAPPAWPILVSEIQRRHEVVDDALEALEELPKLRHEVSRLTTLARACEALSRLGQTDKTAHEAMVAFLANLEKVSAERQAAFMGWMREAFGA